MVSDEVGTIVREARFRMALVYPSPYRAAMSSLGYQIIYRIVNERELWSAERAMLPEDVGEFRQGRWPLFTLEGETAVGDADVVAFSLAYELEIPGLLDCLDLSGIPLRGAERSDEDPIVVIGGPLTFSNPLPSAPFADVVVMGEGEEVVGCLLDAWEGHSGRAEKLEAIAAVAGCYVPSVHGELLLPVAAADNVLLPGCGQIITPHAELANMHLVEAERGCHRKCTFCVMRRSTNGGMRLADPGAIIASIPDAAQRVGLVGAAVSDHPKLCDIVEQIVDSGRGVGLSSLRADRLSERLVGLLARGGYRTLTVASDGASERLRKELQKVIREEHLIRAAHFAAASELRVLKLYMMIGVPGETEDDITELIDFCKEVSQIHRLALGIAPFVSKRNTPLDKHGFAGIPYVNGVLKRLRKELRGRVDIRSVSARWAWVEWNVAQGGFSMADATESAWRAGGGFSAWKRAIAEFGGEDESDRASWS